MTLNQIDPDTDAIMHRLSPRIGEAKQKIEEATLEFDVAWIQVFELLEQAGLTRFLAKDGFALNKQKVQGAAKLDEQRLHDAIFSFFKPRRATIIWNKITVQERHVDSILLERAVLEGFVGEAMLEECVVVPEPVFHRIRREWTKGDKERAQVLQLDKIEDEVLLQ